MIPLEPDERQKNRCERFEQLLRRLAREQPRLDWDRLAEG
jgi:hypothetical protein